MNSPIHHVIIPLNPVPASRPRVTRWGVYYGKKYTAWIKAGEKLLKAGPGAILGPVSVTVNIVVEKPRTSKLTHPRGDVDNYAKAPLDLITKVGGYWHDDDQIVALLVTKRFAAAGEQPHTEVIVYK